MRQVARFHLYLGCFFAPLIIFYALSGAWQTLYFHLPTKDGRYQPPRILIELTEVHRRQRWLPPSSTGSSPSRQEGEALLGALPRRPLSWLSALMGIGLAATTLLGTVLAYQRTRGKRRWVAVGCLAGGCILPVALFVS